MGFLKGFGKACIRQDVGTTKLLSVECVCVFSLLHCRFPGFTQKRRLKPDAILPVRYISFAIVLLYCVYGKASDQFAGSAQCKSCHQTIYAEWKQSDHYHAMQTADADSVLGDFNNQTVEFHGMETRFYQSDGDYFVKTSGTDGVYGDYRVLYTFGFYPLQQYLVATTNGRLQALNVAWDARSRKEGGQRWFHLQPDEDISPDHPFFWTGYFSNWNSSCADCHSTGIDRGYDAEKHQYQTTWREINVACESCHGPAGSHVKTLGPLNPPTANPLIWRFKKDQIIASPVFEQTSVVAEPSAGEEPAADKKPAFSSREIDMCGGCHSRRQVVDEIEPLADYHQQYSLLTLDAGLYFADGRIDDEVFVLGSFLQSKMHQAGVTCTNCHDPHTGRVKVENNDLCGQCHLPRAFDSPEHHHHEVDSPGAQCINCHMPARTYMQVDDRRDHGFSIPRPEISAITGSPDPCMTCHEHEDKGWTGKLIAEWYGERQLDHWGLVNHHSRKYDIASVPALAELSLDKNTVEIIRATLLQQLSDLPTGLSINVVSQSLDDESPLVRRAAVTALQTAPAADRWSLLSTMLEDPVRSVRLEVVRVLTQVYQMLTLKQQKTLAENIKEYRESLALVLDTPGGQLNLANLERGLGNMGAAQMANQQALLIEPNFVPALINLADFYRGAGQDSKARPLLLKALQIAPESSAVNHSYGLLLVRSGQYDAAIPFLARGASLTDTASDGHPRFAYVYAIALDSVGRSSEAANYLLQATEKWPNQYDLLLTLVVFLEKTQRFDEISRPLNDLVELAPASADVQQLVRQYLE